MYPDVYLWTSYPLSCALQILYDQALAHIVHVRTDEPRHSSLNYSLILLAHFLLIEITAMLERIANYGQTGNARVLMPTIMDPLQLSVVARKGTLPYFGPGIKFEENSGPLAINFVGDHWPTNMMTKSPLMASLASIKFHYGKTFSQVRHISISFADNIAACYRRIVSPEPCPRRSADNNHAVYRQNADSTKNINRRFRRYLPILLSVH